MPTTKIQTSDESHWLDKAKPDYAAANGLWRVRKMRKGQTYNWWLKAGKGDPSSTGLVLAMAEWSEIKRGIISDERGIKHQLGTQKDGTFKVLSDDIFTENGELNDGTSVESRTAKFRYGLPGQVHRRGHKLVLHGPLQQPLHASSAPAPASEVQAHLRLRSTGAGAPCHIGSLHFPGQMRPAIH